MSAQFVKRRTHPETCEVEVGVQFEDIGGGRNLAPREWVKGDFATSGETNVAKYIAFCTFNAEVLVSENTVSVFTIRPKRCSHMATLPSYITGGYILPSMIMSIGSLISTGVGGSVADGIS